VRAATLAADGGALRELRQRLAANRRRFPLFDGDRFCRNIETTYTMMWERYQRGEQPRNLRRGE
jgi:predicted O-linked N-acetylglucosamine transferase (SPINDLY family)